MKKILTLFVTFCLLITSMFIIDAQSDTVKASYPLDEIENYVITISPRSDATLDITYHIEWKVLDSKSEGPLEWVKIGVPNRFVDELKYLGDNAKSINYSSDGGAYAEIYFKNNHYEGEIVNIDFSLHAYRMFSLKDDKYATFMFIPGWFEEIRVKKLTIKWTYNDEIYSDYADYTRIVDNMYFWEFTNLDYNERVEANVSYLKEMFPDRNDEMQYSSSTVSAWEIIIPIAIILLIIIGIIALIVWLDYNSTGGYYAHRGYYGPGYYHHMWWLYHGGVNRHGKKISVPPTTTSNSSYHSGGGHSCACACACACAGGGRAGCSRKDFVNNINSEDIEIAVEK